MRVSVKTMQLNTIVIFILVVVFQTSYFIITSAIYIDLMLLGLKNHFELSKFSLYKFHISQFLYYGSEWTGQLTTSS